MTMFQIYKTKIEFLSKLLEPDKKSVPDPIRRQFDAKRNLLFFMIFFGSFALYPILIPFTNFPLEIHLVNLGINLAHTLLFIMLCRSYMWIFHLQYTVFISIIPFALMAESKEMFFFHMGYAFIIPQFIMLMSNNYIFAGIAGFMQVVIFQTKYKMAFVENAREMGIELFAEKFIGATTVPFIFSIVFYIYGLNLLHKRTMELVYAKKEIENALEQQKTFVLSFSHELRNPLNSLLGNLQLFLMGGSSPNESRDMIRTAKICGELLLQHINNVLDTGKSDIGNLEVNPIVTNVHELFQRGWTICHELIKRKGLAGHLKISREMPLKMMIDGQKISQTLLNLIGNAVKFTENGSITVTVQWLQQYHSVCEKCFYPIPYDETDEGVFDRQEKMFRLSLNRNMNLSSEYLVFSNERKQFNVDELSYSEEKSTGVLKIIIKDTGCGMSQESLERLFQKFSQVSDDASKRQIGTGLGLYITKEICNKMGGDIRVYSKQGVGSTFIACIPAVSVPARRESLDVGYIRNVFSQKKSKAIVADDSPFNVSLMCSYFEKIGIEVVATADNGYDAWKKYVEIVNSGSKIDIVSLDINMPRVGGMVACEKIRHYEQEYERPKTRVVLISGNYERSQIGECFDSNKPWKADYFFKKPLIFEEFYGIVYKLLTYGSQDHF